MSTTNPIRHLTFAGGSYLGVIDFPISFVYVEKSHVRVVKIAVGGVQSTLTLDVHYSLGAAGNANGGVLSLIGFTLLTGETLVVDRVVPPTQLADLTNQAEVFPDVYEAALDYGAQIDAQVDDVLGIFDESKTKVPKLLPNGADGASAYDFRGNRGENAADPLSAQDLATRNYVDTAVASAGGGPGGSGGGPPAQFNNAPPAASVTYKNVTVVVRYTGGPSQAMICLEGAPDVFDWYPFATAI